MTDKTIKPVTNITKPAERRWIFCQCPKHRHNHVPFEFWPKASAKKKRVKPPDGGYMVKL